MNVWQEIKEFVSSEIIRNSAKLLTASVIVQIIGLLVYPILTRLYSPENFGLINLFLSISGILSLIATAEFQYAVLLPESEGKAISCFHLGCFSTVMVFVVLVCTIPFSHTIAGWFNAPDLADWYWGIPIFVVLSSIWILVNYWYTRQKQFGQICRYQITQCLTNAGAKCGFGALGFINGGLIISALISPCIALGISIVTTFKSYIKPLFSHPHNYSKTLKEYANFPKFSLPRALINYVSGNLPVFMLTPFFGLTEIGFFGMAVTLAFKPINMISSSLYQVLFQKTSEQVQNRQHIKQHIFKFLQTSVFIIVPCFAVLYFILPSLTELLLGECWRETGEYIQLMLCWLAFSFLVAPICYVSDIFQKQKIGLFFEILLVLTRLLGLSYGIFTDSFYNAIVGYCIGSAVSIAAQLIWLISLITNYERTITDS